MGAKAVVTGNGLFDFITLWQQTITANTIHVRLFQNNIIVDESTVIGDLVECDYSGYAAQDIVLSGLPTFGDGYAEVPGNKASWGPNTVTFPGNSGADQTAYGCYVTYNVGGGGDIMLWTSNCFDEQNIPALVGRTISGAGDSVPLVITTRLWDYVQDQGQVTVLRITGLEGGETQGVPFNVTVTALNRDRTTNKYYAGTVFVFSSDTAGFLLTPTGTLTAGVGLFEATLQTVGQQYVTAVDVTTPTLNDTVGTNVGT